MKDISVEEYESLIAKAKFVDPVNYRDIVHDYLLTGKSFKALKFDYLQVNAYDTTKFEDTSKACKTCNQIKPVACFRVVNVSGKIYLRNECTRCEGVAYAARKKKRYHSDPEFREKQLAQWKEWRKKNDDYYRIYEENNKDKRKSYNEKRKQKNKSL